MGDKSATIIGPNIPLLRFPGNMYFWGNPLIGEATVLALSGLVIFQVSQELTCFDICWLIINIFRVINGLHRSINGFNRLSILFLAHELHFLFIICILGSLINGLMSQSPQCVVAVAWQGPFLFLKKIPTPLPPGHY